jgi:hypothetical protein
MALHVAAGCLDWTVVLSPVYTAVTWQWPYMSQHVTRTGLLYCRRFTQPLLGNGPTCHSMLLGLDCCTVVCLHSRYLAVTLHVTACYSDWTVVLSSVYTAVTWQWPYMSACYADWTVVLSSVYTAVTWQWPYMSQHVTRTGLLYCRLFTRPLLDSDPTCHSMLLGLDCCTVAFLHSRYFAVTLHVTAYYSDWTVVLSPVYTAVTWQWAYTSVCFGSWWKSDFVV